MTGFGDVMVDPCVCYRMGMGDETECEGVHIVHDRLGVEQGADNSVETLNDQWLSMYK